MSQETEIAARVEQLLMQPITGLGFVLLDVHYIFEGRWVLRLIIDKDSGVSLDDCGTVSELAGRVLDVEDPVPDEFSLEVSSPGLFRPLREEKHFRQSIGKRARITLTTGELPEIDLRTLHGVVVAVQEGMVEVELGGKTMVLPLEAIASAKLDPEF